MFGLPLGSGLALVDDHALKVLALGLLGGDFPDDGLEVGVVIVGLGPLGLRQKLVREGALERSSHSEDTVVGLLGTQTLKSLLHNLILLGDQVVGTQARLPVSSVVEVPLASGRIQRINHGRFMM